jgi:hypothetical protein
MPPYAITPFFAMLPLSASPFSRCHCADAFLSILMSLMPFFEADAERYAAIRCCADFRPPLFSCRRISSAYAAMPLMPPLMPLFSPYSEIYAADAFRDAMLSSYADADFRYSLRRH